MAQTRSAAIFGLCAALSSSAGQTYFVGLFGMHLRQEFSLSAGELGTLYGVATLTSGLLMFWLGAAADRLALRTACTIAAVTIAGGAALMAVSVHPLFVAIAFFLLRLGGQGLMGHLAIVAAARQPGKRRGRSIATASIGFIIGEALWPILVVAALSSFDWRLVWGATALALIGIALPGLRKLSEQVPDREVLLTAGKVPAELTRGALLTRADFLAPLAVVITPAFVVTAVFFQQSALSDLRGWSTTAVASAFTLFAGSQLLGNLLMGWLVDRLSARALLRFHLLPLALGVLGFALFDAPAILWVLFVGLGLSAGANSVLGGALWAEIFGVRQLGLIRGMHAALMIAGTAASPVFLSLALSGEATVRRAALGVACYAVITPWIAAALLNRRIGHKE